MSIIQSLKSSYKDWKDKADKRADEAIKQAETKNERDKIKARLAIETAQRKRAVAKAETEQKQAEIARKKADKELKASSGGFDFLGGLFPKKKKTKSVRHRRINKIKGDHMARKKCKSKTTRKTTRKMTRKTRRKSSRRNTGGVVTLL